MKCAWEAWAILARAAIVERLRVGAVDGVASAQHPAVGLLHSAAHGFSAADFCIWLGATYSTVRSWAGP